MAGPTTFWAPVHRALQRWGNPGNTGFPPNAGPSIDFLGAGLQDHRLPYNLRGSSALQPGIIGWYGSQQPIVANITPAAPATANIAALANVATGVAMTLVAASGAGVFKLSAAAPARFQPTGLVQTAGICIEALPTYHAFGRSFVSAFYNRATVVGRAVSITGVVSGTGGAFLVSGFDVYGYPMSEQITAGAGVNTVNGKKAFKVVTSVVPAFTDAHTYSVGVADIYGINIVASFWNDLEVFWNSALVTAATGFVAMDATSPATTTTGDVRGTYAVQSAADGVKRLSIGVRPTLGAIVTNPTTGLFGVAQV